MCLKRNIMQEITCNCNGETPKRQCHQKPHIIWISIQLLFSARMSSKGKFSRCLKALKGISPLNCCLPVTSARKNNIAIQHLDNMHISTTQVNLSADKSGEGRSHKSKHGHLWAIPENYTASVDMPFTNLLKCNNNKPTGV